VRRFTSKYTYKGICLLTKRLGIKKTQQLLEEFQAYNRTYISEFIDPENEEDTSIWRTSKIKEKD
jgi:hypothetical protein